MKMRNIVFGDIIEVESTTDHPASHYGQPVLVEVDTGQAIDALWFRPCDDDGNPIKPLNNRQRCMRQLAIFDTDTDTDGGKGGGHE